MHKTENRQLKVVHESWEPVGVEMLECSCELGNDPKIFINTCYFADVCKLWKPQMVFH